MISFFCHLLPRAGEVWAVPRRRQHDVGVEIPEAVAGGGEGLGVVVVGGLLPG